MAISEQEIDRIAALGRRLAEAGLATGGFIARRLDDGRIVATRGGADLTAIGAGDVSEEAVAPAVADLFRRRSEVRIVAELAAPYAAQVSRQGDGFRAALDDTAQIAGVSIRTARALTAPELLRCLRGRNACLIRGEGMLVTGRSLNEAFATALVTEKGARTHVLAGLFGGARPVPYLSALLMRFIYQAKYSRINLDDERARGDAR